MHHNEIILTGATMGVKICPLFYCGDVADRMCGESETDISLNGATTSPRFLKAFNSTQQRNYFGNIPFS